MKLKDALKQLPEQKRKLLMCAFEQGTSGLVEHDGYVLGVNVQVGSDFQIIDQGNGWVLLSKSSSVTSPPASPPTAGSKASGEP
jgi:hypothetical protein